MATRAHLRDARDTRTSATAALRRVKPAGKAVLRRARARARERLRTAPCTNLYGARRSLLGKRRARRAAPDSDASRVATRALIARGGAAYRTVRERQRRPRSRRAAPRRGARAAPRRVGNPCLRARGRIVIASSADVCALDAGRTRRTTVPAGAKRPRRLRSRARSKRGAKALRRVGRAHRTVRITARASTARFMTQPARPFFHKPDSRTQALKTGAVCSLFSCACHKLSLTTRRAISSFLR